MRPGRIDVGGVTLQVAEAGAGVDRRILLVHGFTGARTDFADHLDHLGRLGWHAVAPDLRGHGASDQPDGREAYSLAIFAADVMALADALGWDRFTLVGHSMGGMVAQLVALDHPERLAGLVLMGTGHQGVDTIEPNLLEMGKAIVRDGGTDLLVDILATMGQARGPLASESHRRLASARPEYAEAGRRNIRAASDAMWLAMVDELTDQPDRLDRLAALTVPTLVLVGEQDGAFMAQSGRMAAAIPGAWLRVIPGAGHSPQFEAPKAWRAAMAEFLDEVARLEASTNR